MKDMLRAGESGKAVPTADEENTVRQTRRDVSADRDPGSER